MKMQANAKRKEEAMDEAHARLIAAAPELLTLAHKVIEFWGSHEAFGDFASLTSCAGAFGPIADLARNAIQKVEGELALDRCDCPNPHCVDGMVGNAGCAICQRPAGGFMALYIVAVQCDDGRRIVNCGTFSAGDSQDWQFDNEDESYGPGEVVAYMPWPTFPRRKK